MLEHLESERLVFRRIFDLDLEFLASLYGDPDVMRFYPRYRTQEDTRQAIQQYQIRYQQDGFHLMLAILKSTAQPIGRCGLVMQTLDNGALHIPEIGYMFAKEFWAQGFATEAAQAFKEYAFTQKQFPKIVAIIRPDNVASLKVAQKIGMQYERDILFDTVNCELYSCRI